LYTQLSTAKQDNLKDTSMVQIIELKQKCHPKGSKLVSENVTFKSKKNDNKTGKKQKVWLAFSKGGLV